MDLDGTGDAPRTDRAFADFLAALTQQSGPGVGRVGYGRGRRSADAINRSTSSG